MAGGTDSTDVETEEAEISNEETLVGRDYGTTDDEIIDHETLFDEGIDEDTDDVRVTDEAITDEVARGSSNRQAKLETLPKAASHHGKRPFNKIRRLFHRFKRSPRGGKYSEVPSLAEAYVPDEPPPSYESI
jgi:hypothetical protein